MRIAAVFCGLTAGLFVLLFPYGAGLDLLSVFLKFWGTTGLPRSLGTLIWYGVPVAAVLGGLLTLAISGLGTFVLAASACAWIAFGLADAELLRYELLAPAAVAMLGAVLAFIGGELELRRRRMARRTAQSPANRWVGEEDAEREEREAALKLAPHMVRTSDSRGASVREIPISLDDLVPSDTRHRPQPTAPQPERSTEPFVEVRPQSAPSVDRKTPLSPSVGMSGPAVGERNRSMQQGASSSGARPLVWLAVVNSLVLLVLAGAVGYLLLRQGPDVAAVRVAASEGASATPATTEQLAPVPAASEAAQVPVPKAELPALRPATAPDQAVAVVEQYTDPSAYCGAVKTIDFVDSRYSGPSFTQEIADALNVPMTAAPDRVKWRCVDGAVYACSAFGWPVCGLTPTAAEMQDFCRRNPDTKQLVAPRGTWLCEGGKPKLPDDASWPVDSRGFFPDPWVRITPANLSSKG